MASMQPLPESGKNRPKSDLWFSRQKAKADEQWLEQYEKLKVYKEHHGDCMVPNSYTEDFSLRDWVKNQRFQYRALREGEPSRMNEDRIRLLEELGFVFDVPAARTGPKPRHGQPRAPKPMPEYIDIVRSKESRWNDRFQELKRFKDKFGHCIVPTKFKPNPSLGCWVSTQRVHFKRLKVGRHTSLTQEKIEKLDSIGFIWDASEVSKDEVVSKKRVPGTKRKKKDAEEKESREGGKKNNQEAWLEMYKKLKSYKAKIGDTLVPSKYKDKSLANWVAVQRRNYRTREEGTTSKRMNEERIALLEEIGFLWDISKKKESEDEEPQKVSSRRKTVMKSEGADEIVDSSDDEDEKTDEEEDPKPSSKRSRTKL